jgi:hypothetical protein
MKSELEEFISHNRESLDTRVPSPAVLERLQQQLKQAAPKKEKAIVIPMKMVRWAAAACIILIGGAIFWVSQKETPSVQTAAVITEKKKAVVPENTTPASTETATVTKEVPAQLVSKRNNTSEIEEENNLRKTMLFAKLNNMESPSQRLTAASQVNQLKEADTDIVDALVKTMTNDPSTNVRLAALDALGRFYRETYVKKKLLSSLSKQTDPMVQIGLIELLTKMKERSILKQLDKIVNDGNTMQAVKDQAYTSIFTLRS